MRLLSLVLASLLCSLAVLSQSKPLLQLRGELVFGDGKDRIFIDKFLDHENQLLLVGNKTIRVLDVSSAKISESRLIDMPDLADKDLVSKAAWSSDGKTLYVISADGKSVLLWGLS